MPMPVTSFGLDQKTSRPVLRISRRRRGKRAPKQHSRKRCYDGGYGERKKTRASASASTKAVAKRLEALRNLIPHAKPAPGGAKEAAATGDKLFEETADYILLLRTQVEVLKTLVDIYSGPRAEVTGGAY